MSGGEVNYDPNGKLMCLGRAAAGIPHRIHRRNNLMNSYRFAGQVKDIALIVAGDHGSELSGVEVAHWIRVKLERRMSQDNGKWKPYYTTVIVPEIYPKSVELGRKCLDNKAQSKDRELIKRCGVTKKGREVDWKLHPGDKTTYVIPPNRQFPPPGRPLSHLSRRKKPGPVDPDGNPVTEDANRAAMPGGVPLLPETREFLRLIEKLKPKTHREHSCPDSRQQSGLRSGRAGHLC